MGCVAEFLGATASVTSGTAGGISMTVIIGVTGNADVMARLISWRKESEGGGFTQGCEREATSSLRASVSN